MANYSATLTEQPYLIAAPAAITQYHALNGAVFRFDFPLTRAGVLTWSAGGPRPQTVNGLAGTIIDAPDVIVGPGIDRRDPSNNNPVLGDYHPIPSALNLNAGLTITQHGPPAIQGECDSSYAGFWFGMSATGEIRRYIPHEAGTEPMGIRFIMGAAPGGYRFSGATMRVVFKSTSTAVKTMAWVKMYVLATATKGIRTQFGRVAGAPITFTAKAGPGTLPYQVGKSRDMAITVTKIPYWEMEAPPPPPKPDDPSYDGTNGYGGFSIRLRAGVLPTTWFAHSTAMMRLDLDPVDGHHTPSGKVHFKLQLMMRRPKGEVTRPGSAFPKLRVKMEANWFPIGGAYAPIAIAAEGTGRAKLSGKAVAAIHFRFINFTGHRRRVSGARPMTITFDAVRGQLNVSSYGAVPEITVTFTFLVKDVLVMPTRELKPVHIDHTVYSQTRMQHQAIRPAEVEHGVGATAKVRILSTTTIRPEQSFE